MGKVPGSPCTPSWNRDLRDLLDPLPPAGLMSDPFLSIMVRDNPCVYSYVYTVTFTHSISTNTAPSPLQLSEESQTLLQVVKTGRQASEPPWMWVRT